MTKEMHRRVARLEAGDGEQRLHVFHVAPDGTRTRIRGEGEPGPRDLVVNVMTHFPEEGTETEPQPKGG